MSARILETSSSLLRHDLHVVIGARRMSEITKSLRSRLLKLTIQDNKRASRARSRRKKTDIVRPVVIGACLTRIMHTDKSRKGETAETSSVSKLTPHESPAISGPRSAHPGYRCLGSNLIRTRARVRVADPPSTIRRTIETCIRRNYGLVPRR